MIRHPVRFSPSVASTKGTSDIPIGFPFLDGLTLVVLSFASGDGDLHLGEAAFVEVDPGWNERESFLLDLGFEFSQFTSAEQQFSSAQRLVIHGAGLRVRGDVRFHKPEFAVQYMGVGLVQ